MRNCIVFAVLGLLSWPVMVMAAAVQSTSPAQNELNVSVQTAVSVTFDQDVDAGTINNTTFIVHGSLSGLHTGTFAFNDPARTATFTPNEDFRVGEIVSITLTRGIQTVPGDPLAQSYQWSFTVEAIDGPGWFGSISGYGCDGFRPAIADLDNDSDLDLVIGSFNYSTADRGLRVYWNDGTGNFIDGQFYFTGFETWGTIAADLDSDGDMDLAAVNTMADDNVSVLLNHGDGTFAPVVTYPAGNNPHSVVPADIDGDGDLDLLTTDIGDGYNQGLAVLTNLGDGTFTSPVHVPIGRNAYSKTVTAADFDRDGDLDLVTNLRDSLVILTNLGDFAFSAGTPFPLAGYPWDVWAADLDQDGDLDLATANDDDFNLSLLFYTDGAGFTSEVTLEVYSDCPAAVITADLDGDGNPDLSYTEWNSPATVVVCKSTGEGYFSTGSVFDLNGGYSRSLQSADLDDDGDLDLVVGNTGLGTVQVLLNHCDCTNFCDLNLDGTINPVDAVYIVNYAYKNQDSREQIPACSRTNGDWNCDGCINPVDVVWYVNYVYRSLGDGPCDPCSP